MDNSRGNHSKAGPDLGRPVLLALMQKGSITADDVARLRRHTFADRSLSRIEIEDLFGLDSVLRPDVDAWMEFFVEAVTDHVVWDSRPTGVLDDMQALWLIEKTDRSRTATSFAVLVNILDEAHRVPRWFEGAVRQRAASALPAAVSPIGTAEAVAGSDRITSPS